MVNEGGTQRAVGARRRRWAEAGLLAVALLAAACSSDSGGTEVAGPGSTPGGTPAGAIEAGYPHDDELRLNEVQVLGSHNSYHRRLQPAFAEKLESLIPGVTSEWDYEHDPLPVQFEDQGVRQIELDVWADPEGGRYATRRAQALAGLPEDPGIPELEEPGFKVFHIQELDVESTCWTFVSCLEEVKAWSDANPGHVPVMILVEAKADAIPDPFALGFQEPIPFDATQLDALDAEIRSVFDDDRLITPDLVRGGATTLDEAVTTTGWPTLGAVRGRVLFALDNGGEVQDAYLAGHPTLEGRVMFTGGTEPGAPPTAFRKLNDPIADGPDIESSVRAGYLVRTRADADTKRGEPVDTAMREAALASGAQFVSSDFPVPDPAVGGDYVVAVPGGDPGRCNPLVAPDWCLATDVENPAYLARP